MEKYKICIVVRYRCITYICKRERKKFLRYEYYTQTSTFICDPFTTIISTNFVFQNFPLSVFYIFHRIISFSYFSLTVSPIIKTIQGYLIKNIAYSFTLYLESKMLKVYNLIKSKCFESEMIIGNGCQRNIDNSITLGCRTKEKKKKILAKFNKNVMDG